MVQENRQKHEIVRQEVPPGSMEVVLRLSALSLVALTLTGCVLALPPFNEPSKERIVVVAPSPRIYSVRIDVEGAPPVQVPDDGRVVIDFPVLPRACSQYFLGIRLYNGQPESRRVICFMRGG